MVETTFGTWLLEQVDGIGVLHLSFQDDQGWLSPQRVLDLTWDEYTFDTTVVENTHAVWNRVTVDPGEERLHHDQWVRYEFSVGGDKRSENLETKLLIEVPAERDPIRGQLDETVTLRKESLKELLSDARVRAVPAGRVAGLESQKQALQRFLQMTNDDWGLADRRGILLEGPPGTGKTELVVETCQELYGSMPVTISGPEILSKWVGESERLLRKKFQEAQNTESKVLYIDEVDAIARSRSEASQEHSAQLVAQLLVLLDGVEAKTDAVPKVIASTNLVEVLDPALLRPGRLGNSPISFPQPDETQREAIFHHYLEQIREAEPSHLSTKLTEVTTNPTESTLLSRFAGQTESFTGADIEDLFIEAAASLQATKAQPVLDASILTQLIQSRDIQPTTRYQDQLLAELDSHSGAVTISGDGSIVAIESSEQSRPERIAQAWCDQMENINPHHARFRSVQANSLIAQDVAGTRDQVIEVFQHYSEDGLCLYIAGIDNLVRMQGRTALVDAVFETIHEQLIRWGPQNLLIHDVSDDASSAHPLAGRYRHYSLE